MKLTLFALFLSVMLPFAVYAHQGHDHCDGNCAENPSTAHLVFKQGALHAHMRWEQGPKAGRESILLVEFKDGATHGVAEPSEALSVQLWMPSMNHGSAPTKVTKVGVGTYRVSNVMFIMRGPWDVRFILSDSSGYQETQTVKINL